MVDSHKKNDIIAQSDDKGCDIFFAARGARNFPDVKLGKTGYFFEREKPFWVSIQTF